MKVTITLTVADDHVRAQTDVAEALDLLGTAVRKHYPAMTMRIDASGPVALPVILADREFTYTRAQEAETLIAWDAYAGAISQAIARRTTGLGTAEVT